MASHSAFSLLIFTFLTFSALANPDPQKISSVLVVDRSGQYGQFKRLQQAIDWVPSKNNAWVEIRVRARIYEEKIQIPYDKPYISIVGEGKDRTIVNWWDGGGSQTIDYSTFQVFADNIVVRNITFKNTFMPKVISQAPATLIYGDKVAFYGCGFIGVQDTLTDFLGRHYFDECYIEGYIDFIWGYGQSIYHGCTLNVTSGPYDARIYEAGYITAQGRANKDDNDGFVFTYCTVVGTDRAYLGRPYESYSRVIFYKTYFSDVVMPQGWSLWYNRDSQGGSITHEEVECTGPGARTNQRVKWGRSLSNRELNNLIDPNTFINKDYWIENQPISKLY